MHSPPVRRPACYNGLPHPPGKTDSRRRPAPVFRRRYQIVEKDRRPSVMWRIPVMDGEFICEDRFGTVKGVAGKPAYLRPNQAAALSAAEQPRCDPLRCPDVILPFPGGIVRSGSKVGSQIQKAQSQHERRLLPHVAGRRATESALPEAAAVYEIVIDGLSSKACGPPCGPGCIWPPAVPGRRSSDCGQLRRKLGPHHFYLRELLK